MNLRTTIVLGILVLLGAGGWVAYLLLRPNTPASATLTFLESLRGDDLKKIEVRRGKDVRVVLTREGKAWKLPGNWPLRETEAKELTEALARLDSRYAPLPLPEDALERKEALAKYGLAENALTLELTIGEKSHVISLGEAISGEENRFSTPTYLRLDEENEVVRLGPGLIARLDRPQAYYQKRQLFTTERVLGEPSFSFDKFSKMPKEGPAKMEDRLLAKEIWLTTEGETYALAKVGEEWELISPRDHIEPKGVLPVLSKLADIWAERFLEAADLKKNPGNELFLKGQSGYAAGIAVAQAGAFLAPGAGLAPLGATWFVAQALPAYSLKVTGPDGTSLTLHVGPVLPREDEKEEPRGGTFRLARVEDARFAKETTALPLFEVKESNLEALPTLNRLRDPQVVRFEPEDVRHLEVLQPFGKGEYETVLAFKNVQPDSKNEEKTEKKKEDAKKDEVKKDDAEKDPAEVKEKSGWRMVSPVARQIERPSLEELLKELSNLRASGEDVSYPAEGELSQFGLDRPLFKVKLTYEEDEKTPGKKDDKKKEKKDRKTREVVLHIGGPVKEAKELKADKGKKEGEEAKDEGKVYVRIEGWPRVNAVSAKILKLARRPEYAYHRKQLLDVKMADLNRLEVTGPKESFVLARAKDRWKIEAPFQANADELDKINPLLKRLSNLQAIEFVADKLSKEELETKYGLDKPVRSVRLGFKDAKKPGHTLYLGKQRPDRPEVYARLDEGPVFILDKAMADQFDGGALAFRDLTLVDVTPEQITGLEFQGGEGKYRLDRAGEGWKVSGTVEGPATKRVFVLEKILAGLRAERMIDASPKDLGTYGLDKPHQKVVIHLAAKKDDKDPPVKPAEKTLLLGKKLETGEGRYVLVAGEKGVFVLAEALATELSRSPQEWLNKVLVQLEAPFQSVIVSGKEKFSLVKKAGAWQIAGKTGGGEIGLSPAAVAQMLAPWRKLEAQSIEAVGSKVDRAKYGLEDPYLKIEVELEGGKKTHVLTLGKTAPKKEGRYAQLDMGEMVVVLKSEDVKRLESKLGDLLSPVLLDYDLGSLIYFERKQAGAALELQKKDGDWEATKGLERGLDVPFLEKDLQESLRNLRTKRIVEFPAKDLALYGLDKPEATVTVRITDPTGISGEHKIVLGKTVKEASAADAGDRYAYVDRPDRVVVLDRKLADDLLAPPLAFADRSLPGLSEADQAIQERDKRRLVLTQAGGDWKMTGPVEAGTEEAALKELLQGLRKLRAGQLVLPKADEAALKKFGLNQPEVTWTFRQGDKEVMKLLVGAAEGKFKDARHYARIEGRDPIFLLTPEMTRQALGEYRERRPWKGLDPVKVEDLQVHTPTGDFHLKDFKGNWLFLEGPKAKVNSKAVTDTLDALASLKVARYVTDKEDKDLETRAGLEKPEWVIAAGGGKEAFVLLVGRKVGETNERYARTENSPAIFILSAADVERLLRPASAFALGKGTSEKDEKEGEKEKKGK